MALNINTNITNNLDGYLVDAKNVKGTYVVVTNYSELANLPSACVVEGTLAYCQTHYYDSGIDYDYDKGFYIYKDNSWAFYPMGIGRIVFDKYNQTNFDITQTYSWAYNDSDISNNLTAILTMAVNGGLLQINFNDDAFLFNYSGISQTNKSSVSMVVIYDNKQYIATVVFNSTDLSNMFTLSFQEIEGGSGGGTGESNVLYKHSMELVAVDGENNSDTYIFEFLSKYATPFVTNGSLADMLTYYASLQDTTAIISPMVRSNNLNFIISQIRPISSGVSICIVNTLTVVLQALYTDNASGITDTVTPYIQVSGGSGSGESATQDVSLIDETISVVLTQSDVDLANATSTNFNLTQSGETKILTAFTKARTLLSTNKLGLINLTWSAADLSMSYPSTYVSGSTLLNVYENFQISGALSQSLVILLDGFTGDSTTITSFIGTLQNNLSLTINFDFYKKEIQVQGSSSGGSSTGGGSGKLYEITMDLTRYDDSGNSDAWGSEPGETITQFGYSSNPTSIKIGFTIYESNFERVKTLLNTKIEEFNTLNETTLPLITDINNLVVFLNTYISETVAQSSNVALSFLNYLCSLSDNTLCYGSNFYSKFDITTWFFVKPKAEASNEILKLWVLTQNDEEFPYGLNVNNSCTLTEYGTSGGSGGSATTKTIYEYTVGQHIDYTITDSGFDYDIDVSPEYKVFIDGDETEIVKNINYVILYINEQLSAIPGFTPFADITNFADYPSKATEIQTYLRTLYTQSILNDSGYSTMMLFVCEAPLVYIDETLLPNANDQSVLMQIMAKSFDNLYNNKYKIKSGLKVGGFDANSYMSTIADSGLVYTGTIFGPAIIFDKNASNTTGQVFQSDALPTAFTPATERAFSIVCRGDAPALTFSYNETTETVSGGSSSSQPTIPERFSLAYNLVVNINQEQFANGSWTGSNSDNIRTFQYNGSNADETKATELVEFLTGVNVLDSYNATKPTPCFVFCTQSNICWKLQWDNSLLHAYKVENFPFVVKGKYYRFFLNDNGCTLQLFITQNRMQAVYDAINQQMGTNISTPQEVIGVYNQLKGDSITPQVFGTLSLLFVGVYQLGVADHLPTLFMGGADSDINTIIGGATSTLNLYSIIGGSVSGIFDQSGSTGHIAHSSNASLSIAENTDLDFA